MSLTEASIKAAIKAAMTSGTGGKKYDERGLFLLLRPQGTRCGAWWRLKYSVNGRERGISLGTYPDVSLKRAREKRDEARKLLADGLDPSQQRQAAKVARAFTFEAVADEFLSLQAKMLAPVTLAKQRWILTEFLNPCIGSAPIATVGADDMLAALRAVESRGIHETAHRAKQLAGRVFRFAVATGRAKSDPTSALRGALAPVKTTNRAALTDPAEVGALLRAIDSYQGQPGTMYALRLAPLVFVRPGELRAAEWAEFELDDAQWRIPAARMKMREQHIVPLPEQAASLLRQLHALTGYSKLLFPSLSDPKRSMSNNTVNAALRRLGYTSEQMTGHGFRAMASTLLNEQGFAPDVIELQLAHAERNKVRAAYNRAQRLPERRKMMQAWANYLDKLKAGAAK